MRKRERERGREERGERGGVSLTLRGKIHTLTISHTQYSFFSIRSFLMVYSVHVGDMHVHVCKGLHWFNNGYYVCLWVHGLHG